MKKNKILFIILITLVVIALGGYFIYNALSSENGCCTCLDCPICDVCCNCNNPYLNK